jgi:Carboxypeptidase regulatory-like domain
MFEHLDDQTPPEPGEEDRRAVRARMDLIRHRHRLLVLGTGVAIALLVAVGSTAALTSGSARRVVRVGGAAPSTTGKPASTEVPTTRGPSPAVTVPPSTPSTTPRQGSAIFGNVRADDGTAIPEGTVTLARDHTSPPMATTAIDAQGHYRFDHLPPGHYVVVADVHGPPRPPCPPSGVCPKFSAGYKRDVSVASGQSLEVDFVFAGYSYATTTSSS